MLEDGDGQEAAKRYVAERKAWLQPRKRAGSREDQRGSLLIAFADEFGKDLDAACGADGAKLVKDPAGTCKALKRLLSAKGRLEHHGLADAVRSKTKQRDYNASELKSYSAFLARYQRADFAGSRSRLAAIELPGQYTGDRPPQPSTHVTLEGVAPRVTVMASLRVPKRVTLQGSDQREVSSAVTPASLIGRRCPSHPTF